MTWFMSKLRKIAPKRHGERRRQCLKVTGGHAGSTQGFLHIRDGERLPQERPAMGGPERRVDPLRAHLSPRSLISALASGKLLRLLDNSNTHR